MYNVRPPHFLHVLGKHSLADLTQLYASSYSLQHLSTGDSLTLLLFSVYLGWLGALLFIFPPTALNILF